MAVNKNITAEDERFQLLDEFIDEIEDKKSSLINVLHKAQEIFGYLPLEVQKHIAEKVDLPLSEVYGVVSFYHHFNLEPKGKYQISVCLGTACYVRGASKVLERIKKELNIEVGETSEDTKYSLQATRCVGACGLAPVVIINDDVYGRMTEEKVPEILEKYK
ncbi:MAG TPA: NAD(P)H-dependent oxidoreductase subunit E [Thermoanaerobacterales bacterium]|nr:NAD(P)H-dependent oxidoreductase subunit E [Thermoanaerobacterales bacterium]